MDNVMKKKNWRLGKVIRDELAFVMCMKPTFGSILLVYPFQL